MDGPMSIQVAHLRYRHHALPRCSRIPKALPTQWDGLASELCILLVLKSHSLLCSKTRSCKLQWKPRSFWCGIRLSLNLKPWHIYMFKAKLLGSFGSPSQFQQIFASKAQQTKSCFQPSCAVTFDLLVLPRDENETNGVDPKFSQAKGEELYHDDHSFAVGERITLKLHFWIPFLACFNQKCRLDAGQSCDT